jgi:hypothetical protein
MFEKPRLKDGPAVRASLRLVASRPPAAAASTTDHRRGAIIGHRLPHGYMSIHAPGQPCGLCDGAPAIPLPVASARR